MDITLLYLLGLILLLFFFKRITRKRKFWGAFFSFCFTLLVTLSVVEVIYRVFLKKTPVIESGNFGGSMNKLNNTYGYTVKDIPSISHRKVTKAGDTIYNCTYSIIPDSGINKQDINHRVGYTDANAARIDSEFVFLGCSFTFGSGINDTATLPYKAGQMSGLASLNLGGSGWGTHHVYQLFTHKYNNVPDNKKRIFVYSFIPDHVVRAKSVYSWSLNDPYFTAEGDSLHYEGAAYKHSGYATWHIVTRALSLNRILSFVSDLGNIFITMSASKNINEEDYKRVQLMMSNMNEAAKKRGDRFIIVHWNDYKGLTPKDPPFVSKEKMAAIFTQLQAQGAEIMNVGDVMDMNNEANFIPKDNHPNHLANGHIARRLVQMAGR